MVLDLCVCSIDKGSCGVRLTEICVCRTEREIIGSAVSVCPTQRTLQVRYLCANSTFVWWSTHTNSHCPTVDSHSRTYSHSHAVYSHSQTVD